MSDTQSDLATFDLERSYSEEAQAIWSIFADGTIHYARAYLDRNSVSYHPVEEPLTIPTILEHLNHDQTYGVYQLLPNSTVRWIAWDIDAKKIEDAQALTKRILDQLVNVPLAVSYSGGKGFHIFLFLKEPVPASQAKIFAESIRDTAGAQSSGDSHVECFPKQAALTPQRPHGNLIKLPLGRHPRTHNISTFVDPSNGWEKGPAIPPLEALSVRVDFAKLRDLMGPSSAKESVIKLMTSEWPSEGKRHDAALAFAGVCAKEHVGFENCLEMMEQIVILTGDDQLDNRIACVKDTYQTFKAGGGVTNWEFLGKQIKHDAWVELQRLLPQCAAPNSLLTVDKLRLRPKTPIFLKERDATIFILRHLEETGRLLKTKDGKLWWFSNDLKVVFDLDGIAWQTHLLLHFGIHSKDAWGVKIMKQLQLKFAPRASMVAVHRRSYWDERSLFVHLDGPVVYRLDGEGLSEKNLTYNGDCGYIFTDISSDAAILDDLSTISDVDCWDELVNDVHFATSKDGLTNTEQRELLKAWILSFFFPQLLDVRPMLCCLGDSGSGKTTTLRRLLRVIESPYQDVLGIVLDKPDAFRSTLAHHKLIILDNLEKTKARWLVDMLNRIITGSEIELRKLYATNEVERIIPDASLGVTAVELPFSEATLYSRTLPLKFEYIEQPAPEYQLQQRIIQRRSDILHSLLLMLDDAVRSLKMNPASSVEKMEGRLADFNVFAQRLKDATQAVEWNNLQSALPKLVPTQNLEHFDKSVFCIALEYWLREGDKIHYARTLASWNTSLKTTAEAWKLEWPYKNGVSLYNFVRRRLSILKERYAFKWDKRTDKERIHIWFGEEKPIPPEQAKFM